MGETHRAGCNQTADQAEESSARRVASARHDANEMQATCPKESGRVSRSYGMSPRLALIHSDLSRNAEGYTMCEERTRSFSTLPRFIDRLMVCIGWKFPRPHIAAELAASLLRARPGLHRSHTSEKHMKLSILAGAHAPSQVPSGRGGAAHHVDGWAQ